MSWIYKILSYLDRQKKLMLWGSIALFLLGLGAIDYFTGVELTISLFYLFPISLASWSLGKTPGRITGLFAAIIWQTSNLLAGEQASSPFVILWNTTVRLAVFLIYSSLLSGFRGLLEHQTELSRTDPLTGILNRRAFYEAADLELKKIDRYQRPLTVVFIDLDNFKAVNDASGHLTGDKLLQCVAQRIKVQLRGTDTVARLGGDGYALLLPETNEAAAGIVIPRMQKALMQEMREANWPVTFSMGTLTCNAAPPSAQEMMHLADQLMYAAKRGGKNCIEYASYPIDMGIHH
jgi:diguanylate cyclase (GGDEF)-like protein